MLNPMMNFAKSKTLTVGTSAVQLDSNTPARRVLIINTSAGNVYLGGSDVTTSNGFPIAASSASWVEWWPIANLNQIYAIADASSQDVRIFYQG